tara:strand:+ start:184 stop:999 length:816 start_codon:yes stop_codon:yes gene_type:complete
MEKVWITINDKSISLSDLPPLLDRYNLLPSFLRNIIEDEFTRDHIPSEEEQKNQYSIFLKENKIENLENLNHWLNNSGLDEKRLSKLLFDKLRVQKFKDFKFKSNVQEIFLKQKSALDQVMYSMITLNTIEEAEEIFYKLEEDEISFSELSSSYSIGSEKDRNGLIGPLEMGKLKPEFSERLRISNPGQLWPPFKIKNFWFIIRFEKLIPAKLDDSLTKKIIDDQYENWINKQVLPLISEVRKLKDSKLNVKDIEGGNAQENNLNQIPNNS